MGEPYGYRTNYKSKTIKSGPVKSKSGKVLKRLGRGSGVIGLGLVALNIHRHGVQKTVKDEAEFSWSFSPIGMFDDLFFDNRVENYFSPRYGYGQSVRTIDHIAKVALLEALL